MKNEWNGFKSGNWCENIDVSNFIKSNYSEYTGNEEFLAEKTERTSHVLAKFEDLLKKEKDNGGVLDVDTEKVSSLLTYKAGYIDEEKEIILGIQTDFPLKRGVNPFGGIRMARQACEAYGYTLSKKIEDEFTYKTTHNDGVFRVYSDDMKKLRSAGVLTGLPDAYGRGRIIGDYRRIALYGIDYLIEQKKIDKEKLGSQVMLEENIKLAEEVYRQIDFLKKLKEMAKMYNVDISKPATNGKEAVQWLYFGYLASIKEQNGAAMSLGRVSTFLDVYFERDLAEGKITEIEVQEIIDDFVLKLRMARQLRTSEYNELFAGDPMWITESIGGIGKDGRSLVTKTSFRMLHTLDNLGASPEPNLTILWSKDLPQNFKNYCSLMSIKTDSIQYENDELMREKHGDDYAIACCVSAMTVGKEIQFFGARCNLAKLLLMTLNGGKNEINGAQIGPVSEIMNVDKLDYDTVNNKFDEILDWMCKEYVNTMNIIHYMHDKYAYEKTQMALHDTNVHRYMAFGIAGLSVVADSLSAIKYADVKPITNEDGTIVDFKISGDFPKYGNGDERVDLIANELTNRFISKLRKNPTYRNAEHTLSILTITSNVVYGKKTGNTPDGRKKGEPFAPGANPMHNREVNGALASLISVSKISYDNCRDGVSCTFSITPKTLGKDQEKQKIMLSNILDGYFNDSGHHININVLDKSKLVDAMENPEKYPNLTIRVSGYAVKFNNLSRQHQLEVIARTYHERI